MSVDEARPADAPAASGAAEWRDALDSYATTLEAQRAYLDAVASGTTDAEPPAAFAVPTGLPAAPDAVREMITTLHAATLTVLALHADLPDRLERPRLGIAIARRETSTATSVLDRAL
jgi:hypothetical protein